MESLLFVIESRNKRTHDKQEVKQEESWQLQNIGLIINGEENGF